MSDDDDCNIKLGPGDLIELLLTPKTIEAPMRRDCLICELSFKALGKHNRVCDKCKTKDQWFFDEEAALIK